MIYSVIGLIFDLIGVLLLFVFGILPDNLWKHIVFDNKMSEKDEKIHKLCSKIAISFVLLGFALQLVGTINQSYNSNEIKNFTKTINLGIDKNETLDVTGELKLKF
jgi:ABC-type Fe3+-siderophore transport system permease subunit